MHCYASLSHSLKQWFIPLRCKPGESATPHSEEAAADPDGVVAHGNLSIAIVEQSSTYTFREGGIPFPRITRRRATLRLNSRGHEKVGDTVLLYKSVV
jgi:hypothetical protein